MKYLLLIATLLSMDIHATVHSAYDQAVKNAKPQISAETKEKVQILMHAKPTTGKEFVETFNKHITPISGHSLKVGPYRGHVFLVDPTGKVTRIWDNSTNKKGEIKGLTTEGERLVKEFGGQTKDYLNTKYHDDTIKPTPIPEPTTLALFAIGIIGLFARNIFKTSGKHRV